MKIELRGTWLALFMALLFSCSSEYKTSDPAIVDLSPDSEEQFLKSSPTQILFLSSGFVGGPFDPLSKAVSIKNSKRRASNWRVSIQQAWLSASKSSGTLPPNGTEQVSLSINETANSLGAGIYTSSVVFYENNRGYTRSVKLTVKPKNSCGNNTIDLNEVCDGTDLAGNSCNTFGYAGGTLACLSDCSDFDKSRCTSLASCGNNVAEFNEDCDGTDLAGESCETLGYATGTLACLPDCSDFDTTGCTLGAHCGNNIAELPELCDGFDLAGNSCQSLGYSGGTLACLGNCSDFDTTRCTNAPVCGNNIAEMNEACDGRDLAGKSCESLGYSGGTLACLSDCSNFDVRDCSAIPPNCTASTNAFQNFAFSEQRGIFEAKFTATPNAAGTSGLVALSDVAGSYFGSFPVLVGFTPTGLIQARNGGAYSADIELRYAIGTPYHFRVEINIGSRSYDVYVSAAEGTEQQLANDYAFRTERADTAFFANYGIIADAGSMQVCDFSTRTISNLVVNAGPDKQIAPGGSATLTATVSGGKSPYTYSWSPITGLNDSRVLQPVARPSQTTDYRLTVTDSSGVVSADTALIIVTTPNTVIPIGRWDIVPYQRINAGETLNLAVVAFSKNDIAKVSFRIESQSYTGPNPLETTQMSLNPQTGVVEYWVALPASAFSTDGIITVKARIHGADGGVRDETTGSGFGLDPLKIVVNPKGSLRQLEAWVSRSGSDSEGLVGSSNNPFATIGKAVAKIRDERNRLGLGNNANGGIVRLSPGEHNNSTGGVTDVIVTEEWVTITTASGGTIDNTVLLPGSSVLARRIHLKGITLRGATTMGMSYNDRLVTKIWVDHCKLIGSGRGITTSHPIGSEIPTYFTDTSITEVHQATSGAELARGLTINKISDDAFQNVPMIVNSTVDDIDPLGTGAHADVVQYGGGIGNLTPHDNNAIVYNVRATNLKYQNFNTGSSPCAPPSKAQGIAWVNIYTDGDLYIPGTKIASWGGWYRWVDHLLWWNVTFRRKGASITPTRYMPYDATNDPEDCAAKLGSQPKQPPRISNFSAKGNFFAFFEMNGTDEFVDFSDWDQNHFHEVGYNAVTRGRNITIGDVNSGSDQLDAFGIPIAGSQLLNRLSPLTPFDAANRARGSYSDVGAYER